VFPHPLSLAAIITAYYAHYTLKDAAGIRALVFIVVIVMISVYGTFIHELNFAP
jgi:hypothetical protein